MSNFDLCVEKNINIVFVKQKQRNEKEREKIKTIRSGRNKQFIIFAFVDYMVIGLDVNCIFVRISKMFVFVSFRLFGAVVFVAVVGVVQVKKALVLCDVLSD